MPWLVDSINRSIGKGEGSTVTNSDTTTSTKTGTVTTVDSAVEETTGGSDSSTQTVNEDAGMTVSFKIRIKGGLLGPSSPPAPLCS